MFECERYEEGLIDLAFGAPAEPALEAHLTACAGCRARLEQERRLASTVDRVLAATLEVSPAPGFDLAVRRRQHETRPVAARGAWLWAGATGLAAAAALILALLLRPPASVSTPPVVAESTPSSPQAPTSDAPLSLVVVDEPVSRVVAPHRAAARRTPKPPELEVLVPPDQQIALRRLAERLRDMETASTVVVPIERPLPSMPAELEVGTLADLPRLSISEPPAIEPAAPLKRLASGGDM